LASLNLHRYFLSKKRHDIPTLLYNANSHSAMGDTSFTIPMFLFLQHLLVNSSIVVSSPPLPPPSPSLDIKAEEKKNRYLYKIPMPCSTLSSKMWPGR
jgi:hypothetical protein